MCILSYTLKLLIKFYFAIFLLSSIACSSDKDELIIDEGPDYTFEMVGDYIGTKSEYISTFSDRGYLTDDDFTYRVEKIDNSTIIIYNIPRQSGNYYNFVYNTNSDQFESIPLKGSTAQHSGGSNVGKGRIIFEDNAIDYEFTLKSESSNAGDELLQHVIFEGKKLD